MNGSTYDDEANGSDPGSERDASEVGRGPRILVVDRSTERRRRMVATVRRLGCRPIEASTPLEAIGVLQQRDSDVAAAAVAEDLTQTEGRELLQFLAEVYADMRLALVTHADADELDEGEAPALLVSDRADFAGPMRRLLGR